MIGVEAHTYARMHSRIYAGCLRECKGNTTEAKQLAAYYMRDWYVLDDGPTQRDYDEQRAGDWTR